MKRNANNPVPIHLAYLLILMIVILFAADGARGASAPAQEAPVNYALYERNLIEVKFHDGPRIRLRNGVPTDLSGPALQGPQALGALQAVSDGRWTRTHRLDEATLDNMRAEGIVRSGRALPDLNHWFRLELPPGMEAAEAVTMFLALPEVEAAILAPTPAPPPFPPDYSSPNDDNFDNSASLNRNVYQRYLDAAPAGLDFRFAWDGAGGTGDGIAICDVEYGWNEDHADLPAVTLLGPDPDPSNPTSWYNHGTAVLGQLGALDNGWGVTGMAPEATFYFAAADTETGGYNLAAAITTCADELEAGDIILLEQQVAGPNATGDGQQGLVAVEWNKAAYDAIVSAVANDIIVVQAAGNGSENLDDAVYRTGNGGHHPFKAENDSGALIVGSANSPYTATPRSRLSSSNYGSTVDLQGWGRDIVTAGYGLYYDDEGENLWFTHSFGGTSGASPMVTAAAAIAQSTYVAKNGTPATPATVRTLLRQTGTPQAGSENIGPQPDMKAAIEQIWNVGPPQPPTISPATGVYNMPILAMIDYGSAQQNMNNTSLRFTLDGSEPGVDDYSVIPEFDEGIYLLYDVTLTARAYQYNITARRLFESDITAVTYSSSTPKAATPVISPGAGTYNQPHQVTITSSTPGVTIRYRTDGRAPSLFYPGALYTGPFTMSPGSYRIAARAYRDGYYNSDAAHSGEIFVNPTTLPAPQIVPDGGQFAGDATVTMQTTVAGADIRYTLDGSTPTLASPIYDTPLTLTSSATVRARTFQTGYTTSPVTTASIEIIEQAAAPAMTPNGGVHSGSVSVTLSTSTLDAEIRYTDNGSEPAHFSTLYEGPFILGPGQHTVRAKAFLPGSQPSATSEASFTVYEAPDGTVENPTMTPFHTQYFVAPFTVSMHTVTEGATIYYTMQHDMLPPDPTMLSTPYTGPISISAAGNWYFKMRAFKTGSSPSEVVQSGMLSLGMPLGVTNVPTITPNGGVFTNTVQVTVSSPDTFETIYYTRDGSDPVSGPPLTPPSQLYSVPFNISSPTIVSAQAYRPFFLSGGISSAEFTFICATPVISPAGGTFDQSTSVSMATRTSNARITYTLDGSEPQASDAEYDGPFALQEGSYVIKARCFRNNFEPSATALSVLIVEGAATAPDITVQPESQDVEEGATVTFAAQATGSPAPLYQWQRDGINLAGQTEPELTIAAARPGDAGQYRLVARNSGGETISAEVTLTVKGSPPGPGGDGYYNYLPMFTR